MTYYAMRYKNGGTPADDDYVTHAKYGKGKVVGDASYVNNTVGVRFEDGVGYRHVMPEALTYTGRYEEPPPPPPKRWTLLDERLRESTMKNVGVFNFRRMTQTSKREVTYAYCISNRQCVHVARG